MFNTFKNLTRKSDRYGDLYFISLYGSILSRLAYFDDNNFFTKYSSIMGPIIHPRILTGINNVSSDNLTELLNDQSIYGLDNSESDIFKNYEYRYTDKRTNQEKNFIDFNRLNIPYNVNIINNEVNDTTKFVIEGNPPESGAIRYISIGWSNYGEVYVVADKRMPNTILLLFRGTYSAKTAALYSKPTSIIPLKVCTNSKGEPEQFLYGIFKATSEMIHTIVEAMRFLAKDFLKATEPNSVKIITAGHSLGGAMCTNFAYLWMGVKKTAPYKDAPYNILADNIVCLSYGAPRCMSSSVANKFCEFVEQNKILYLRITTRGDPVPALPPKTGFQHPCSQNENMRKIVSEDCNNLLTMRPLPNVKYESDLDCQNYKTRAYIINPIAHTIYLDILYTSGVDIPKFFAGIGFSKEVLRDVDGSTICRLIMCENNNHLAIFFNVNKARQTPTNLDNQLDQQLETEKGENITEIDSPPQPNYEVDLNSAAAAAGGGMFSMPKMSMPKMSMPKIGGKVNEDTRMTAKAFNNCINNMEKITATDKCPQKGKMCDPFNNEITPDLSCPGLVFGGKRRYTRKYKIKKLSKSKNNRKIKSRKNKLKYY